MMRIDEPFFSFTKNPCLKYTCITVRVDILFYIKFKYNYLERYKYTKIALSILFLMFL